MTITPNINFPYIVSSQAQKEITHNTALNEIDFLIQPIIVNSSTTSPPAAPANGKSYIISSTAAGAWAGYEGYLAAYYNGWIFKKPAIGWTVWNAHTNKFLYCSNISPITWSSLSSPFIEANYSWSPGTIANNSSVSSLSISVTGASVGDLVQVSPPYSIGSSLISGHVNSANSVMITIGNLSGSNITLGNGNWYIRVVKK